MDTDLPPAWASPNPGHPATGPAPVAAGWPPIPSLARAVPPSPLDAATSGSGGLPAAFDDDGRSAPGRAGGAWGFAGSGASTDEGGSIRRRADAPADRTASTAGGSDFVRSMAGGAASSRVTGGGTNRADVGAADLGPPTADSAYSRRAADSDIGRATVGAAGPAPMSGSGGGRGTVGAVGLEPVSGSGGGAEWAAGGRSAPGLVAAGHGGRVAGGDGAGGVPGGRSTAARVAAGHGGRVAGGDGAGGVPRAATGVATWLPEGRWADPEDEQTPVAADPPPKAASGRVSEERRRRGQRRVAAARVLTRLAGWPRRALAVALLLAAVVLALRPEPPTAAVAPAPPGVPVVVAGRDLPAGAVLTRPDLRTTSLPTAAVPAGSAREPAGLLGRTVAGPVRRGEVLTDARVVGPGLTAGLGPGEVAAVPVRLADAQAAALVRAGDRVDVLGAPVDADGAAGSRDAVEVAAGVRVLAVLPGDEDADGVVIVVAAAPAVARRLAGAGSRHRLTVAVRPP